MSNCQTTPVIAYHFVGNALRDGSPVPPDGTWLVHSGPLEMCRIGLHASVDPFDALQYAPGPILCKVEVQGRILHQADKLVAEQRKITARFDASPLLRLSARKCAQDVLHLWDAPQIVKDYLNTGEETLRAAAGDAAWAAARAAAGAWAAAGDAAWAAAWAAAWDAAWAAARDAAWAAARAAAWDAAWDAAWAAAGDAARDTARAAARAANAKIIISCAKARLKELAK